MPYTPPAGHAVNFDFRGSYTGPGGHAVNFAFGSIPVAGAGGALRRAVGIIDAPETDERLPIRRRFAPPPPPTLPQRSLRWLAAPDEDAADDWFPPRRFAPPAEPEAAPLPFRRRIAALDDGAEDFWRLPRRFARQPDVTPPAVVYTAPRRPRPDDPDDGDDWLPQRRGIRRGTSPDALGGGRTRAIKIAGAAPVALGDAATSAIKIAGGAAVALDPAETAAFKLAGAVVTETTQTAVFKIAGAAVYSYYTDTGPSGAPPALLPLPYDARKRAQFAGRTHRAVAGQEVRLLDQPLPIWTWVLSIPPLRDAHDGRADAPWSYDELRELMGRFLTSLGEDGVFAYDDPTDNWITGQELPLMNNSRTVFQAVRTMGGFVEPITYLKEVTALYYDGSPVSLFGWDVSTGLITARDAAPGGAVVTADFTYYFRVRFADDLLDFENLMFDLWHLAEMKIQSVLYP